MVLCAVSVWLGDRRATFTARSGRLGSDANGLQRPTSIDREALLGTNLTPEEEPQTPGLSEEELSFSKSLERAAGFATLSSQYWSCPGSAGFIIRGRSYLKVPSASLSRPKSMPGQMKTSNSFPYTSKDSQYHMLRPLHAPTKKKYVRWICYG